jgi:Flp pilus assembly protein TadD
MYRLVAYDRWAAFGGLWFFVTLLPVSQIIPHHEMMAEHYLYLPSAGLCLTVGTLLERALADQRRRAAIVTAFALVVVLLGLRTVVRNRDWRNSQTLWSKTVLTAPGSARAHNNVGEFALKLGRDQQAFREFLEAVRIKPDEPIYRDNLGAILLRHGEFDEAEKQFREAIRLAPQFPTFHVNLGLLYLNRRQLDEAEQEFRAALASWQPTRGFRAAILNNLGIVLALKGKRQEAEQTFAEAIRIAPEFPDAHANLGKAYVEKGMIDEGVNQLSEAVRLKASDARFHYLLADAYYRQGRKEIAVVEVVRALSLRSDFPEAQALLHKINKEKASGRGRRG